VDDYSAPQLSRFHPPVVGGLGAKDQEDGKREAGDVEGVDRAERDCRVPSWQGPILHNTSRNMIGEIGRGVEWECKREGRGKRGEGGGQCAKTESPRHDRLTFRKTSYKTSAKARAVTPARGCPMPWRMRDLHRLCFTGDA